MNGAIARAGTGSKTEVTATTCTTEQVSSLRSGPARSGTFPRSTSAGDVTGPRRAFLRGDGSVGTPGEAPAPHERIRQLERELAQVKRSAVEDLENLTAVIASRERVIRRLQREMEVTAASSARADEIREIARYYRERLRKTKAWKFPVNGKRWKAVAGMLDADHSVQELKEAVDGVAAMPFVGPRGRCAQDGPGCSRQDELELVMRDETNVQRFRDYAALRRAETSPVQPDPAPAPRRARASDLGQAFLTPIDRVLAALPHPVRSCRGDHWMTRCPAHEDSSPSLSIHRNPDGKVLLHCFAGCDTVDVLAALGLQWRDLWDGSEHDPGAIGYVPRTGPSPHLRRVAAQLQQVFREAA